MKRLFYLVATSFFLVMASGAAAQTDDIPTNKQTKLGLYVTAADAAKILDDPNVVLIDIRTHAEVEFLGLPTRANVHIPYMTMSDMPRYDTSKGTYALERNPAFEMVFEDYAEAHEIGPDTPIILMCRSGSRSAKAADVLAGLGYTKVYSLVDGFEGDSVKDGPGKGQRLVNGWKNAGLEWSYTVRADQAYPDDQ